jgi:hypothetical protein
MVSHIAFKDFPNTSLIAKITTKVHKLAYEVALAVSPKIISSILGIKLSSI